MSDKHTQAAAQRAKGIHKWRGAAGHVEDGNMVVMITVRLRPESMADVRRLAIAADVSAAEMLRRLIEKGMKA